MVKRSTVFWSLTALAGAIVGTSTLMAGPGDVAAKFKEVTLSGRLVDLHCFMTDTYPSSDRVKCTRDRLRAGVPAALETPNGVIIIGMSRALPKKQFLPLAYQDVEISGRLFERHGMKYLEMASIVAGKSAMPGEYEEEEGMEEEEYIPDDDDDSEPEEDEE